MSLLSFLGGLVGIGPTRRTITISKAATNAGLPFVIGEARLKAISVFTHISQQNGPLGTVSWDYEYDPRPSHGDEEVKGAREWLHRIDVFAQGPITSFERFYVDSDAHTSARFGTRPYFRTVGYFGSATQAAFSWGSVTSKRGSNHRGVGVAYAISRFYAHGKYPKYNSEPIVEAVLQGIALYDPRPAAAQTEGLESSYIFSENPPLGLLGYLTADTGADWGFAALDVDSFKVAADLCDVAVTIPARLTNNTGSTISWRNRRAGWFENVNDGEDLPTHRRGQTGTSQTRIKGSFILDPEAGIKDNIEALLTVMHGHLPFSNGKYKLIIEDTASAVDMAFDDDSILGNWKVTDGGRKDRLNRATVTFINKNKSYKEDSVSWPALDSAAYTALLAEDSGEKLHQTFDVPAIPDYYQAEDWAEFQVRNSRANKRVTVDLAPKAMLLEFGDVISLTSTARDYTAKWFRVRKITLKVDGTVTANLVEYDGTIYSWSTKTVEPLDDPGEAPFVWDDPIALANLNTVAFHDTNDDGTVISGFNVSWDAPVNTVGLEHIEVAWKLASDTEYDSIMRVLPENTMARIMGLADARAYTIRVTYRTSLGQISVIAVRSSQSLTASGSRVGFIEDYATNGDPYGMTENLLGVDAGPEQTSPTTGYKYTGSSTSALPIANIGVVAGEYVSLSGEIKSDGTGGTKILIKQFDSSGVSLGAGYEYRSDAVTSTAWTRMGGSILIDAACVYLYVATTYVTSAACASRSVMLNRGPKALPYVKAVADGADVTDYTVTPTNGIISDSNFRKSSVDGLGKYWSADAGGAVSIVDGVGLGGGPVLRFTADGTSIESYSILPTIYLPVNTGDIVVVKVRGRQSVGGDATGSDWRVSTFHRDASGGNKGWLYPVGAVDFPADGVWYEKEVRYEILTADVVEMRCYLLGGAGFTTGTIDIDYYDVYIMTPGMGDVTEDNTADDVSNIRAFPIGSLFDTYGRFADNERMPMLRNYSLGTSRTANPITAVDSTPSAPGGSATINVATHTVYNGDGTGRTYNSGSITGLAFSTGYTVWVDDPDYDAGSVTYIASTAGVDAGKNLGRYLVGYVTTPADQGSSSSGGGGGGFDCVAADMWLTDELQAANSKQGSMIDLLKEINGIANGDSYTAKAMIGVDFSDQPCVEIETSGGARLVCSITTPVTLRSGQLMPVTECLGGELATLIDGEFAWQEVIHIDHVGKWPVAHIHAGGRTFAAGSEARARIFTHNTEKP